MKYKVAIIGLGLGGEWAHAVVNCADTELVMVCDPAFGRNPRLAYDARLSCSAYVTKRESDLAFSPLKLMTSKALNAPRNSLNVCGVKFSPLRASVRRLTTPLVC